MPALRTPLGIAFQERDFAILRGLFDSRVLTLSHISRMYFDGRDEAAKKRVQKLKNAGFITERPRRIYEPAVLHLTRTAFQLLEREGHLVEFPKLSLATLADRARVSDLTIRHELDVQEVKTALTVAVNVKKGFRVAEFLTWPLLYQFEVAFGTGKLLVKPDGFVRITEQDADGKEFERMFFLEVDRSTESQDVISKRAACYREYYQSGRFAQWRGGKRENFRDYPFRVLWTFKTPARRDNAARSMLALNPPLRTLSYLTTQKEIVADVLGAIWTRPVDYQTALNSTPIERVSAL